MESVSPITSREVVTKNYNSEGVVAHESGQDARSAHSTLYHDSEHPSFLQLGGVK